MHAVGPRVENCSVSYVVRRRVIAALAFLVVLAATGCGSGIAPVSLSSSSGLPVILQTVQTVQTGATNQFTAVQQGTVLTGGAWSVVGGGTNGTITASGMYTAPTTVPSPSTVTVQYLYTGQSYMVYFTVVATPAPGSPITVQGATPAVAVLGTDQLTAMQQNAPLTGGQWSVIGGASNGSIDASGLYSAPSSIPNPNTVTIEYILGGQSGTASLTIVPIATTTITVQAAQPSVEISGTDQMVAMQQGNQATGGTWVVIGGASNGTITALGLFQAPSAVPAPSTVQVGYIAGTQIYLVPIAILPSSVIVQAVAPSVLTSLSTNITVTGIGFTPGSAIGVNAVPVRTTYVDSSHLSGTVVLSNPLNVSLDITVIPPGSIGSPSNAIALLARFPSIQVLPAILSGGPITLSISGSQFSTGDVVSISGAPLVTTVNSASSITATGFLPPWTAGSVIVQVAGGDGLQPIAALSVPIQQTAVTFDAASRFANQAAFGPRPDVVMNIQQLGFDGWITQQFQQPALSFSLSASGMTQFLHGAAAGNSLLRQRLSFALQSFIVPHGQNFDPSSTFFERMLETDCSGNFRQLLTDITASPNLGDYLNLANNSASVNTLVQPNQNFARELMQLFSLGPFLLNDDGSFQTDGQGNLLPTYDQSTVIDLTRALTGWTYPSPVNQADVAWGIDWSQPLTTFEARHDHNAKLLFGTVFFPPNQTATQDRSMALDVIFNHPNLPPFLARLLIQRLVTSNPTPGYIQRVSTVFKDNGSGVRGDMTAVVRAILLDPEARLGDTYPSASDGFLKEPVLWQLHIMSVLNTVGSDDQPNYLGSSLGEALWNAPTVFGFFSPSTMIPGTTVSSPEFGLMNNLSTSLKSQVAWAIVKSSMAGFTNNYVPNSWLFQHFTTVPAMVDALNHVLYHGNMSQQEMTAITDYCATLNPFDVQYQLKVALFLALDAESNDVSQ